MSGPNITFSESFQVVVGKIDIDIMYTDDVYEIDKNNINISYPIDSTIHNITQIDSHNIKLQLTLYDTGTIFTSLTNSAAETTDKFDRYIVYNYSDSVKYTSTISLSGSSALSHNKGDIFIDPGYVAISDELEDITPSVVITGDTITDETENGIYRITYTIPNSSIKSVDRIVVVKPNKNIVLVPSDNIAVSDIKVFHEYSSEQSSLRIQSTFEVGDKLEIDPTNYSTGSTDVYIRQDGSIPFNKNVSLSSNTFINVADPIRLYDAVNYKTLIKMANKLATTSNKIKSTLNSMSYGVADSISILEYRSVKWILSITGDGVSYASEVLFVNSNNPVTYSEYSILGDPQNFSVSVNINNNVATLDINNNTLVDSYISVIRLVISTEP